MAPALVELSTSKERNSNSKQYIQEFSCMSRLNLDLVEKIRLVDSSPLYTQHIDQKVNERLEKENHSFKVMLSNETNKAPISNIRINNVNSVIGDAEIPSKITDESTLKNKNNGLNGHNLDISLVQRSNEEINGCLQMKNKPLTTTDIRLPQPVAVAKYNPSSSITKLLDLKQASLKSKFSNLNTDLNSLSYRLHKFCNKDISSHVACYVTKSDEILRFQHKNENDPDVKVSNNTHKHGRCKHSNAYSPLKRTYDLINNVGLTDDEEDFDSKQRIPLRGKKQKSVRPAPPASVLNQWKQNRAKIGSQCSWLTLKMAVLDDKISTLNKLHSTLKTNRIIRNHTHEEANKNKVHTTHNKNGFILTDTPDSLASETNSHCGCSRTRPVMNIQHHKYIRNVKPTPSLPNIYRCRCINGYDSCRLCTKPSSNPDQESSNDLVELCDQNYHSILSQKSDVSLAFLLEDTLRRQRINAKVTITKSKKKKKRPLSLSANHFPIGTKTIDKQSVKIKSERSKSDEYSRKRYAASDISSKLKKFRKLSESCDSGSKPSTPTNELASPLSQSFPSTGLSGLKKKKGSSSVDYDINNIVIPYSMAASTRVERIQYKEIPTPGWRTANELLNNDDAELDPELTDDETYSERHYVCESLEQKRFTDYFQPVRRQRSMRTSEGPNSEPHSPHMFEERSLVNTPVDSPNASSASLALKLLNRLANLYVCQDEERDEPWLQREFPLSDAEGAKLEALSAPPSPDDDVKRFPKPSALPRSPSFTLISNNSPRNSPLPSPSPLASPVTPDSNWTVKVVNNEDSKEPAVVLPPFVPVATEKQRKGIVLKLAKK